MNAASLPLLTTSALQCYRTCPRAYLHTYENGYRPSYVNPNLRFGTLGHHGLETWFTMSMRSDDRLSWLHAALEKVAEEEPDRYERAKAEALMIGYHTQWADADVRVLAVEREFVGPLVNPGTGGVSRTWRFGGKMDVVAEVEGILSVIEHKFSSEDISAGSDYWLRLTLDPQVSNYLHGAKVLGYDVQRCIYDVIGKPMLRPKRATPPGERKYTKPTKKNPVSRPHKGQREADETAEEYRDRILADIEGDPQSYFVRQPIVRLEEEARAAAFDAWQAGIQIRDSKRASIWPRNPHACKRYGRACEFLPVCTGQALLSDSTRYRRTARPHEELSEIVGWDGEGKEGVE